MSGHTPEIIPVLADQLCREEMCDHLADDCPTKGAAVCVACTAEDVEKLMGDVVYATPWRECRHKRKEQS